jgi:hypothetical protein
MGGLEFSVVLGLDTGKKAAGFIGYIEYGKEEKTELRILPDL